MIQVPQRAVGLLRGLVACAPSTARSSTGTGGVLQAAPPLGWPLGGLRSASEAGAWAQAAAAPGAGAAPRRCFSSWEGAWASPRQHMYSDVAAARNMLPHRSNFVPQFHAHGFQLIPESLLSPLAVLQQQQQLQQHAAGLDAAAALGGGGQGQQQQQQQRWAGGAGDGGVLYADSVKRKRKLKMKRHKYRKRMRALKASLKK